jgi:hypothetical protein
VDALMAGEGAKSTQERGAFLGKLAEKGIKGSRAIEATQAFSSGLLTEEEALRGGGRGQLAALVASRRAGLSDPARNELAVQEAEAAAARFEERRLASKGFESRFQSAQDRMGAADRGALGEAALSAKESAIGRLMFPIIEQVSPAVWLARWMKSDFSNTLESAVANGTAKGTSKQLNLSASVDNGGR